jgi:hypothetical protein
MRSVLYLFGYGSSGEYHCVRLKDMLDFFVGI